jgi:hypothetical protein
MSYAMVSIVYGVPLSEAAAEKIQEWEDNDDPRYFYDDELCGFTTLYSQGGPMHYGYCGVEIGELQVYGQDLVSSYRFTPTAAEKAEAEALVAKLDPELKQLAGPIGTYFIWHDS